MSRFRIMAVGAASLILITLIVLLTNKSLPTPPNSISTIIVSSWSSYSLPITSSLAAASLSVNNETLWAKLTGNAKSYGDGKDNTHLVNCESRMKNARLNATDFVERMRGRELVFVDDSLNRDMWESLVCILLGSSIKDKTTGVRKISEKGQLKKQGLYTLRIKDYNFTINYVKAPFMVEGQNGSLRLDPVDETTKMYPHAQVVIFDTGHLCENISRGENYYADGTPQTYGKALRTWGRWVDRHVKANKTLVFFTGYSGNNNFRGATCLVLIAYSATLASSAPTPTPPPPPSGSFSFYRVVMVWPKALCHKYPCNYGGVPPEDFKMHGIWPADAKWRSVWSCSGNAYDKGLIDSSLRTKLKSYWPGYTKENDELWKSEWEKHGTCSDLNQKQYLEKGAELSKKLAEPIKDAFLNRNIQMGPSKHYLLKTLLDALIGDFKHQPEIWCVQDDVSRTYLNEVVLCYDTKFQLINCPPPTKKSNCGKDTDKIPIYFI